jgi:hypothetical protein
MNVVLRNILAVLGGFAAGSALNMGLILLSPHVIPPPAGVDVSKVESMKASMHLFQPKHFLFPFLAHAVGTWGGASVAYLIAGSRPVVFAYVIGGLFLAGGIAAAQMIPAPTWFIVVDLVGAYLPMAWLATHLGRKMRRPAAG